MYVYIERDVPTIRRTFDYLRGSIVWHPIDISTCFTHSLAIILVICVFGHPPDIGYIQG